LKLLLETQLIRIYEKKMLSYFVTDNAMQLRNLQEQHFCLLWS